jgi:hypothetical protein
VGFVRRATATSAATLAATLTSAPPIAHEATAAQRSEDSGAPCDNLLVHHTPASHFVVSQWPAHHPLTRFPPPLHCAPYPAPYACVCVLRRCGFSRDQISPTWAIAWSITGSGVLGAA